MHLNGRVSENVKGKRDTEGNTIGSVRHVPYGNTTGRARVTRADKMLIMICHSEDL